MRWLHTFSVLVLHSAYKALVHYANGTAAAVATVGPAVATYTNPPRVYHLLAPTPSPRYV